MTKHTPGPWHTGRNAPDTFIVSNNHGYLVATCDTDEMRAGRATVEANARLIAAAPDLRDFAKNVGGCDLESLLHSADLNYLRSVITEWVTEARAAIAKTEGC